LSKREKFDLSRGDRRRLWEKIVHGAFLTEGTMVAFPTCFPGVTIPVPADESHITAMDVTLDGNVYAGTSGRGAHLLVGMFHGITGMVFDMGQVEGAESTAAMCCGRETFVAAVNGSGGGRLIKRKLQELPFDLIQEWGVRRTPMTDLGEAVRGERIVHAVTDGARQEVIGLTEGHVFRLGFDSEVMEVVGEVAGRGRLARGSRGGIFGRDEDETLWRYDVETGVLARRTVKLPSGEWGTGRMVWARDTVTGRLYVADEEGRLFSFSEEDGFSGPLGQVRAAPVGAMAVTTDGRVFGSSGEGMARLFCYEPKRGEMRDLGVAVSVLERRRYGYSFGDAVVGRDGEIIFGEDDDLGHVWLYFPRIAGEK
jgi:hypothetical protein